MDRIKQLCAFLEKCESFADVACDHGYVAQYMLRNGLCKRAVVSDISDKCLSKARNLLSDFINAGTCRAVCCDGLEKIEKDTDFVFIAGIGGEEIIRILKNAGADGSAVPDRRKDAGRIEFKRDAERVFEQYQKYRETYPNSVQPMPEGDCAVCPDCRGKGLLLKKLPLLKVDVGKVCKTCGGSGFVPQ